MEKGGSGCCYCFALSLFIAALTSGDIGALVSRVQQVMLLLLMLIHGRRIGLLVDMDTRRMDLFINDMLQGTLAEDLTQPLYFCVDFGWPGQVTRASAASMHRCVRYTGWQTD